MELLVFTFSGLALAMAALGLGALLGRAPLRRGCDPDRACEGCARPCRRAGREAGR
jgi:hypothetical protein